MYSNLILIIFILSILFYCEFLIYYLVLFQCNWPQIKKLSADKSESPIKAMIMADTHLLGPQNGHWLDKLRREWQMNRSFQSSIALFEPEIVFILGDLFDEGQSVVGEEFHNYVLRFHKLFHVSKRTRVISAVGNHDIGFHYRLHPYFTERFDSSFNSSTVMLHTIRGVHFITINSMAMENDGCYFCEIGKNELEQVSQYLDCYKEPSKCTISINKSITYSRPILLQHFPTYRKSDAKCIKTDSPNIHKKFRENWEVLSKESTLLLGKFLNPRLAFSGHSHHFCHTETLLDIEEYTLASFSWRNKNQPSFLLALFTKNDHSTFLCYLPAESTVLRIYGISLMLIILYTSYRLWRKYRTSIGNKIKKTL